MSGHKDLYGKCFTAASRMDADATRHQLDVLFGQLASALYLTPASPNHFVVSR